MAQTMPQVGTKRETHIGLLLTAVHDSNFAGGQIQPTPGLKSDEWTLRPLASFQITQPIGRHAVFLNGTAGYDFHQNNPNLDSRRVNMTGGGVVRTAACQTTLVGVYSSARSETLDDTQISIQNQRETTSETLGVACQLGRSIGVQISGVNDDITNSVPRQRLSNHSSQGVSGAIKYGRPALGTIGVLASYTKQDLPNAFNANGGIGDGYTAETLGVNYQKLVGQKLNITVGGGVTLIKRDFAPAGIDKSPRSASYSALATYRLNQRMDFTVNADRSVQPSNQPGKLYDVTKSEAVSGNYRIGQRFTLGGGASIVRRNSNNDTTGVGLAVTNSRNETIYASIRYQQSSKASLTFDVRQVDRKTNIPVLNYSDTRFSLTTAVNF